MSGMSFALPLVPVNADGTFTLPGVPPGKYHVSTNFSAPALAAGGGASSLWSARSGMLDGVDVLDRGLDVRPGRAVQNLVISFTDQPAAISGKLIDASGAPVPDLTIVVFSTNRGDWTPGSRRVLQPIRPASDGTYSATGLPPGEYYLAALTDIGPDDWPDPSFMEQIAASAIKITLGEGEKKVQDVKLSGRQAQTDSPSVGRDAPSTR
jgi:hypothetical protein